MMIKPPFAIVRLARSEDIVLLPDIERSAAEAFRSTAHAWVADDGVTAAGVYPPLILAGSLFVAEVDGAVVGFVSLQAEPDTLHVLELAVAFAYQRRGVGRLLMQAAIGAARSWRLPAVTLTTFRDLVFNAPFYHTLGFEPFDPPSPRLHAILLAEERRGLRQRCAMRLMVDRLPAVL